MHFFRSFIIFLFFGLPFCAEAQYGCVEGYVCDDWNETVHGAVIVLKNEKETVKKFLSASTDQTGYYRIDSIPEGRYKLSANYIGYIDYLITGININDTIQIADIHLRVNNNLSWGGCPSPVYIPFANIKHTQIISIKPDTTTSDSSYTITGTIRNEEGKLLKKAVVTAFVGDSFINRALSDQNGHYSIPVNSSKPFLLNYHAKYKGRKRRTYFYPVVIIEDIPKDTSNSAIDVTFHRAKYVRCNEEIIYY